MQRFVRPFTAFLRHRSTVAQTESPPSKTVKFTSLQHIDKEDSDITMLEYQKLVTPQLLADRVMNMLLDQKGIFGGCQVDLLDHGLQTATRAYNDGAEDEVVVGALLHDIGEILCPNNHGSVVSAVLRPYISQSTWWVLEHHEIFQGYYYFHHTGGDRDIREKLFRDHEHYQTCVDFCEKYDAPSFDPGFRPKDPEFFRPAVEKVFSRPTYEDWPDHPKNKAFNQGGEKWWGN